MVLLGDSAKAKRNHIITWHGVTVDAGGGVMKPNGLQGEASSVRPPQ